MLRIKKNEDEVIEITFNDQLTVLQVKEEINRREAVEISRIRLIAAGNELEDNYTLQHYNLTSEQTIILALRPADTIVSVDSAVNVNTMGTTDNNNNNELRNEIDALPPAAVAAGVGAGVCLLACTLAIASAVDIAAVIIGMGSKLDTYCDFTSSKSNVMDPNRYLLIGGWVGLATIIVSFCFLGKIMTVAMSTVNNTPNVSSEDISAAVNRSVAKINGLGTLISLFNIAWGSIGCAIYSKLSHSCRFTPVGEMVIAFGVIKLVSGARTVCNSGRNARQQ